MAAEFSPRLVRAVRRLRGLVDQPTFDAMLRRCWPPSRLSPDVAKLERLAAEIAAPRDTEALAAIVAWFEGTGCLASGEALHGTGAEAPEAAHAFPSVEPGGAS